MLCNPCINNQYGFLYYCELPEATRSVLWRAATQVIQLVWVLEFPFWSWPWWAFFTVTTGFFFMSDHMDMELYRDQCIKQFFSYLYLKTSWFCFSCHLDKYMGNQLPHSILLHFMCSLLSLLCPKIFLPHILLSYLIFI